MIINTIALIAGLILLWIGADFFIKGGRIISGNIGMPPLLIGLTFGAIGTSMPELIVSSTAAFFGNTNISIGNIIGSNMANIGLALGLGAIVFPVPVEKQVIRNDYWILLGSGVLLYCFSINLQISSAEGLFFIVFFVAYAVSLLMRQRFTGSRIEDSTLGKKSIGRGVVFFLIGICGLAFGAQLIVNSASAMARLWGVTETIIGISVVAIGTSLPEIAVVIAGSIRKQPEISIGTIIGSNIINILLITGVTAIIAPISLKKNEMFIQAPAVIMFTVLLLPVIVSDKLIKRYEGILLFVLYVGYLLIVF
ncbi:calcium/sodium antiporter [Elusimicrobiota bacterium]